MYAEPITNIYILFLKKSCIKEVINPQSSNKFDSFHFFEILLSKEKKNRFSFSIFILTKINISSFESFRKTFDPEKEKEKKKITHFRLFLSLPEKQRDTASLLYFSTNSS